MPRLHPIDQFLESFDPPMTEREFAEKARIDLTALSRVLRGHRDRLGPDACLRMSQATGGRVSVETLLTWKSTPDQARGRYGPRASAASKSPRRKKRSRATA